MLYESRRSFRNVVILTYAVAGCDPVADND